MTDLAKEDLKPRQTTVNMCNIKTFPQTTEFFPTKNINHKNVIKNHWVSLQSPALEDFLFSDYLNCFRTTHALILDLPNCCCHTLCVYFFIAYRWHTMLQQYALWTSRGETNFLKTNTQDIVGKHYCSQSILSFLHLMWNQFIERCLSFQSNNPFL